MFLTPSVVRAAPFALLRNFAQNGCGAKQFLGCREVRAAPFALRTRTHAEAARPGGPIPQQRLYLSPEPQIQGELRLGCEKSVGFCRIVSDSPTWRRSAIASISMPRLSSAGRETLGATA